ncbi:MAG: hypothetical protein QNI87_01900 [Erythrobacter sp.]|uniref:P-II family nitrogen regulator n=1 Tax=Erythrobacter sp. TaxID=1042 RepID=UPI00262B4EFF|nr:hypothetical protein [Erythrobacter sp.]MDJ0977268.1 hypothetical protein [Erythrobacter sp.]
MAPITPHKAAKVVIVTEKLIEEKIEKIILDAGATGYTVLDGSGKGAHSLRTRDRPSVVAGFALVRIEVIVADRAIADCIAENVSDGFFENYSGIIYLDEVEVLRREKF